MRSKQLRTVSNVVVGKPDTEPDAPSHVRGVFQGNEPHKAQRHKGIEDETPVYAKGTARRSTGINAKHHDVIDPRMPRLSPS